MKPHTGIASISTDSVTRSASSGSDAAISHASRSNEVSARLRLAERREKLRMLTRHGSGDSSNHDGDGGKKGKARPVIHVSRGSRLVRKDAASANEDRRRRRSWSPENHANRRSSHGRRSRQRSPARASRDRGGSRPRRHGELKRSESSGRLERARKPSSMEPRGPSRLSQGHNERVALGRERVLQRSASFDDRGSRLQRSSSMPERSAATNDRRPRAAFERNGNHESKERPSRVGKATERRSTSACGRDGDRQVNRNAASLVKNHTNRPICRRKSSGQSKPSSREADKRRILQQSRKFNADSEKRAQVRPMDNGTQRSKTAHALNDPRAVEKVTHFRDKTKVAASSNLKSDTDRTNEALRQANLTLLSSQLTKFNFKSHDEAEGKAFSSSHNGKALVPVPPLAPARRIGRVQSSNRKADEKNNHEVIPVSKGEIRKSRSNDVIDVYKKGIHGEANEKIAPSSEKGHISRAGDKIVAQDKRPEIDEKETRFVPQEEKVHKSSAMDKFEADEVLNHNFDDDDDNVSIDLCLDTSHLETAAQLDRRVSSLTLRESDWKLDLASSLLKFDESNNTTVQDVALIERGTSPAVTGEGVTHESGQASNTNEEGISSSNTENYHRDIVHFQEKTSEWQQQATNGESIDVIEIDDLDDSIIYSSQKNSKQLIRRLSSMNDSTVTDGVSILEAVPQVNNMSFRDLANQLTGRKTKAADVSHIDAESTSSFFADVSPPVKNKQVDHHIRNEKVDEIVQKISKCREKSCRIIQESLQQTGHIGDAKKMVSLTATTNKHVSQKFPPPPPRRTHQTTSIANQQPDVLPSPPARISQLVRLPQDCSSGTPLSPSHTKGKISSPRPPPPPMPTYRKHASTGTAIRQTSPQEFHHDAQAPQAPPPPPLYGRNASTGNPKVDAASHSAQRCDPVDHLLSQLQHVDGMSPGHPKGFRRSISGGSVKNDQDQAASNNLQRRNSTGVLRNTNHATNNTQSREVSNMPYRDTIGGRYGVYTGQVDQWGRPHGQGKILYTTGVLFEGNWINGVPCQAVPPFQPGPVSNLNGTTGDLTHFYCMTPSVYGAMPPSTYYNTSQLNMSMNSFNNSMNWDYR